MDTQKNPSSSSSSSQDFKKTHDHDEGTHTRPVLSKTHEDYPIKKLEKNEELKRGIGSGMDRMEEESGRERLKKHRREIAGRVWIPDIWGQEELLKEWIDCSVFDSSLGNSTIISARAALVQEARSTVRIENPC